MKTRPILTMTTAVAAALLTSACQREATTVYADRDTAVCSDRNGQRVADEYCRRGHGGGAASSAFLWYYLGRNSAVPYYGDRIGGGSFARTAGATYFHAPAAASMARSAAVSRGGFGASGRSFGSAHS